MTGIEILLQSLQNNKNNHKRDYSTTINNNNNIVSQHENNQQHNMYYHYVDQWNNDDLEGQDDDDDDHPEYYMSSITMERIQRDSTLTQHDKMIIQKLACRKFHIPGNTFWEDYIYWFQNNHPFFCFYFADHRLHPLGKRERFINLVSSLAFGLCSTCCVVLWFHYNKQQRNFDRVLVTLTLLNDNSIHITTGMLALLLFSGPIHVVFDLGLFFLQSCPPFRPGGCCEEIPFFVKVVPNYTKPCCLWIGSHLAVVISITSVFLAINVMFIRASVVEDPNENDYNLPTDIQYYSFLLYYLLEVFISNFIAFPICTFIVFSGVLGCCGRIPVLGGRPYQVQKHARMMERAKKRNEIKNGNFAIVTKAKQAPIN